MTTKRKAPVSAKESWTGKNPLDFQKAAIVAHEERLAEFKKRQKWCEKNKEELPPYLRPRISQIEESIAFLRDLRGDAKPELKTRSSNE